MDRNAIQMQALRLKNAGDPRPLPQIIQELTAAAPDAPPAPVEAPVAEVEASPASPVSVGQPVAVRTQVPPMTTPFSPVDRARAATPEPAPQPGGQAATVNATDAAVQNAQQRGAPEADYLTRARENIRLARQEEMDRVARVREETGVDPHEEEFFRRREERYAKQEADLGEEEKLQAWNALAMAGFKMAQTTSPYFTAALAEGLQAGLQGYNSSRAEAAEKRARLEDARDTIGLERLNAKRRNEDRALGDMERSDAAAIRALQAEANALDMQLKSEREPLVRQEMQLRLQDIRSQMADRQARLGLAYRADARAAAAARAGSGGGQAAFARAYQSGIGDEAKYGREYAEKAMEMSDLRPGDPGYAQQFQAAVAEGRSVFRASNPQWSGIANAVEGVKTITRPAAKPVAAKPKEEEGGFWSWLTN